MLTASTVNSSTSPAATNPSLARIRVTMTILRDEVLVLDRIWPQWMINKYITQLSQITTRPGVLVWHAEVTTP